MLFFCDYCINFSAAGSIISGQITAGSRSGSRRNIDADDPIEDEDDSSDEEDETADLLNELNKVHNQKRCLLGA